VLKRALLLFGKKSGIPQSLIEGVVDEIVEEAEGHLQFRYQQPTVSGDRKQVEVPTNIDVDVTVEGQQVEFTTPSFPILMNRESTSSDIRYKIEDDIDDWVRAAMEQV